MRFNQIPSNTGIGLEMKVIAAVVVGGVAIRGGRGNVAGTLLGVVLLGAIGPALTYLGVSAYWERALQGAIILAAVVFDAASADHVTPRGRGVTQARQARQKAESRTDDVNWRQRMFPNGEWVLLVALVVEVALFSAISRELRDASAISSRSFGSASSSVCSPWR